MSGQLGYLTWSLRSLISQLHLHSSGVNSQGFRWSRWPALNHDPKDSGGLHGRDTHREQQEGAPERTVEEASKELRAASS